MAQLVHSDSVFRVDPGTTPDYAADNPLVKLLGLVERSRLAAEREVYDQLSLQHLYPLTWLQLYGPAGANAGNLDATQQDDKNDFQKQNVRDFHLGDTQAVRGWASAPDSARHPFLQLSYRAGPDSVLSQSATGLRGQNAIAALGDAIGCVVSVGGANPVTLRAPYDEGSGRYLIELWGRSGDGLRDRLDARGKAALDAGLLSARPDVVAGGGNDFDRDSISDRDMRGVASNHAMHPLNPLYVDVRWTANADGSGASDPAAGTTRLGFEMRVRGWDSYLSVGRSLNPHGGVGFLEYRNLFSNYFGYRGSGELARPLEPWNFDAAGRKGRSRGDVEPWMSVEYMDLHVLDPACGIGLHRHRDNQEVFLMMEGDGIMVIGDWADSGTRARAFEVRRLPAGSLALLKGGNLHALMNPTDQRASLFMFGGYD